MNKTYTYKIAAWTITILTGLAIASFVVYYLNITFPIVGKDYKYNVSRLVDTHLFYRVNGLAIQWYTPSFGGGLPAFPNPQNSQFSLPQFLAFILNPWIAILGAYFVYILLGFWAVYSLLYHSMKLEWPASILGATLFSANGFYIEHMAAGHLPFQAFPLLPIFLAILLHPKLSVRLAGTFIGLAAAMVIYSASIYPTLITILSTLLCLPLIYLINAKIFQWKILAQKLALGIFLAITLNLAKIYAAGSFMRFFPRDMLDRYNIPIQVAPFGLFLQLFGVMGLTPVYMLTGAKLSNIRSLLQTYTGTSVGLWELDLSISPVIWILLGCGLVWLIWNRISHRQIFLQRKKSFWIALGLLLALTELTLEFTFARGWFYPLVHQLPFLRSVHINPRFGAAFLLPLATLGAFIFSRWIATQSVKRQWLVFLPVNLLVLISLGSYFIIPFEALQERIFYIGGLIDVYDRIEAGDTFPIESIADTNDQRVFDDHASNILPYEALFGYSRETFKPEVVIGPIREIRDGAFNMTDPTGLVYPEVNNSSLWSRIPESERAQLEDFLAHRQPDWQISFGQKVADWISLLSLILCIGLLGYEFYAKLDKFIPRIQKINKNMSTVFQGLVARISSIP